EDLHGAEGLPHDEEAEDEEAEAEEAPAEDDSAPDDALGLYLRQMGAIPLLTREQELTLAKRLERQRLRYRCAALSNWRTLDRVVETFERVSAGQLALDPTIDVVTTRGLSRQKILDRMPHNLRTLRHVIDRGRDLFRQLLRAGTQSARARLRRDLWRCLRKAVKMAEELSPRID